MAVPLRRNHKTTLIGTKGNASQKLLSNLIRALKFLKNFVSPLRACQLERFKTESPDEPIGRATKCMPMQ
jgi:hypothetical protein